MTDREAMILQALITEYSKSGHEVIEHHGEQFARIVCRDGIAIEMTDVCITRLARDIARCLERRRL